jgi:signal peptidase I
MPDLREFWEFLKDVWGYILTVLIIAFIFLFIVAIIPVAGNSMNPSLSDGNLVLVSRINNYFGGYKRGNIITFTTNDKKSYVKRIIGLPGERIDYLNGSLLINNVSYNESYLNSDVKTSNFMFEDICNLNKCPKGVIPKNMYLVLGDNRIDSKDSRELGLISIKEIKGKIIYKIYPFGALK